MRFGPGSFELEAAKIAGAAVLGFIGGIVLEYKKRHMNKSQRVAQFLTTIAGSLEGIAASFDRDEKPTTHGHILEKTVAAFGKSTGNVLGEEKATYLRNLNNVIELADHSDGMMGRGDAAIRERMETSRKARQVAGDLLGEAAKLNVK